MYCMQRTLSDTTRIWQLSASFLILILILDIIHGDLSRCDSERGAMLLLHPLLLSDATFRLWGNKKWFLPVSRVIRNGQWGLNPGLTSITKVRVVNDFL